jgi:membrane protein DedA with SNARE-associated domain
MHEWVLGYLATLGAGGLLLGVIVEALGVPFPGGLMVVLAGFLINQGKFNFWTIFLVAVLGFNAGALIAFFIGRQVGEPFLTRFGRLLHITPQRLAKAREWLGQSAAVFIIFGRFVPMISNLTPYIAGLSGLSTWKFVFYNLLFTLIWTSFNLSLGILFEQGWGYLLRITNSWMPLVSGALILLFLVFIYLRRGRRAITK